VEADPKAAAGTLPIDIQGTVFQERVWRALRGVPHGTTTTYTEIAKAIHRCPFRRPRGRARLRGEPHRRVIPCHRVGALRRRALGLSMGRGAQARAPTQGERLRRRRPSLSRSVGAFLGAREWLQRRQVPLTVEPFGVGNDAELIGGLPVRRVDAGIGKANLSPYRTIVSPSAIVFQYLAKTRATSTGA